MVQTGIERLVTDPSVSKIVTGKRLGLLANPASVNRNFQHSRDLLAQAFPGHLKALFSPQHGFFSEKQDNMIASSDIIDPFLKIPIFSLYGPRRIPEQEMLELIDTLIIDLQDVGTRVYTFIYTMALCLEAARKYGKEVVVLDRPNPIGGNQVEGNCLNTDYTSFVGMYPIPMRPGLTVGEIARLFNEHFGIGCNLTVVPMSGWKRDMYFSATSLPWVIPSPNLPTPASALVYPGQVLWEGTNISEGRGTALPFELFGAPFIKPAFLKDLSEQVAYPGVHLRCAGFEPTSNKWQGTLCYGFQLHVTDPMRFQPYKTTLSLLQAVLKAYPEEFEWKKPPYEYEYEKLPIDLIIGDKKIREAIESFEDIESIEEQWADELKEFEEIRKEYFLY
ncbi:MAG: DUF1343 domain-containing protein [Deltaproteobacteria bacterium]|nr:DUF1343 domain-containing protein [Deltaproteobacteria bacterium]